jgi:hypothetical protein
MALALLPKPMPGLPRPAQKVCWRHPDQARAWGWEAVFGPGPFEVVGILDNSDLGLATGLVLRTDLGEWAIAEVWLALAPEPEDGGGCSGHRETGCAHVGNRSEPL